MSPTARADGLRLWARQVPAIVRLELRRSLLGRWALPMYFLGAMPVLLMTLWAVAPLLGADLGGSPAGTQPMGVPSKFYSGMFQGFVLPLVVFFGCVGVFTNLFRGDVVDRSLHYWLLSPVRREVIVAGKFLSGLAATGAVFTGMTVLSYLLLYGPHPDQLSAHFLGGPGMSHLLAYVGITWLACVGYGAVFLVLGLLFRNPVIPAAFVFVWESVNFLLPAVLKKVSVIHYLHALAPVPVDVGPFALIAEPTSPWLAVPGLLVVCAALLVASGAIVRRIEIRYGND